MFGYFKKKNRRKESQCAHNKTESEHVNYSGFDEPKWIEVGKGNPFDQRILDIRCITLKVVATTKEKWIAENYTNTRSDDGKQYIDKNILGSIKYNCNIRYPHNGDQLDGIVSKAESMDVKWDIYAYGDWFYFVRSWTSELIYKVHYKNTGSELILDHIITSNDGSDILHAQNIHSIMLTHALGRVWPYTIPNSMEENDEKDIALYLFSQFGCKATIATKANVLDLKIVG
jgi:hypothetical protein